MWMSKVWSLSQLLVRASGVEIRRKFDDCDFAVSRVDGLIGGQLYCTTDF